MTVGVDGAVKCSVIYIIVGLVVCTPHLHLEWLCDSQVRIFDSFPNSLRATIKLSVRG